MPAHRKDYSKAIELYESGLSVEDVGLVVGLSRQAVWAALDRRGVKFRSNLRYGTENHFYKNGVPQDERVHLIVTKAITRGRLVPKPCEDCGASGTDADGRNLVDAHHDDYNKPLDVRWLCGTCHKKWHEKNEPIRRTIELPPIPHSEIARIGGKTTWKRRRPEALKQLAAAREAHWGKK